MNRPLYIGIMGGPKVGKTHLAATVFESKYIDRKRVLYLDNHGSTAACDLPQYTDREPWGVKYISPDDPTGLYEFLLKLRVNRFSKGQFPYDVTVVDDWSEFAQADIEDRLDDGNEGKTIRHWGKHGEVMRSAARLLHPSVTHAHHIAIFQAAQLPDPLEARPREVAGGVVKYTADTRATKLRPFLQGSFAAWFPYKLDALWYQYMEIGGDKYRFYLQLVPTAKVAVVSRWLNRWVDTPRLARKLENPTFDAILELVEGQLELREKVEEEKDAN